MSIYTKILATVSTFAIAAALLVTPSASAATGVTITGYSNSNPSFSLCLFGPGGSAATATVISSGNTSNSFSAGLPVQPLPNGSTYTLFVQNASNSCTNGSQAGTGTFVVYPNHMTTVATTFNGTVFTVASSTVINQSPYYSSNNGNLTVNLCLGSTTPVTVEFTDPDNDNLVGATSNSPISSSYVASQGKVTYTVYPTTSNTATLGNTQTQTFTAQEQANAFQATAGTLVSANVNFVTVNCGSNGNAGNAVVSSSSMMSSSSSMAAPVASAATAVASSSMKATVEIDAPSAGKGSATVRTGGAY